MKACARVCKADDNVWRNVCTIRITTMKRIRRQESIEFNDFAWLQFVHSQTLVDVVFANQTIERKEIETIGRETFNFRLSSYNFRME